MRIQAQQSIEIVQRGRRSGDMRVGIFLLGGAYIANGVYAEHSKGLPGPGLDPGGRKNWDGL